jgi:biopolymer transport protein ExbB
MLSRIGVLLIMLLIPTTVLAWWNDDWNFRKQITLDTGVSGADLKGDVTDALVLMRLHTGNFGYFLDMLADGSDLRLISGDDKTPLKFHIEKFDPLNEMAYVWVRIPYLGAGTNTQTLWMYYGNTAAKAGQDTGGTYDVNQVLVYHFNELSAGAKDSTAYGNNPVSSTAQPNPASLIGAGVKFTGSGESIQLAASPSLRIVPEQGWTFSTWIKLDGAQQNAVIMESRDGNQALSLRVDGTQAYVQFMDGGQVIETNRQAVLNPGAWQHVALVVKAGQLLLYIDGSETGSVTIPIHGLNGNLSIGVDSGGNGTLSAEIDEVQVSNVARSDAWLKAAVKSQGVEATLAVYGADEQKQGSSGQSYFTIILQNVTVDGWVVIGILAVMAVISWIVMLVKGMVIGRVRKDNRAFLNKYREMAAVQPDQLDRDTNEEERELEDAPLTQALFGKHDHFQSSTLYHIYHTGIHEVNTRMARSVGAQTAGLSLEAISTIRAAVDATVVREAQKLNNQMVLLTIAISGGPFLGLLGTVVGVMITFAAIAATGDVNINAIAPGIAAALVATVAGLAVAIPALFGYNYLGTRIKDITADMHVFVDELVTQIAEYYVK